MEYWSKANPDLNFRFLKQTGTEIKTKECLFFVPFSKSNIKCQCCRNDDVSNYLNIVHKYTHFRGLWMKLTVIRFVCFCNVNGFE